MCKMALQLASTSGGELGRVKVVIASVLLYETIHISPTSVSDTMSACYSSLCPEGNGNEALSSTAPEHVDNDFTQLCCFSSALLVIRRNEEAVPRSSSLVLSTHMLLLNWFQQSLSIRVTPRLWLCTSSCIVCLHKLKTPQDQSVGTADLGSTQHSQLRVPSANPVCG